MLDVIYCLAVEDRKERNDARRELDAKLDSLGAGHGGRPDRATWGRTPEQQRLMKNAQNA